MRLLFSLLPFQLVQHTANAAKEATIVKTFKFKDDFFLKMNPLATAIAPVNTPELLDALDDYGEKFRNKWVKALEEDLSVEHEACYVIEMSTPEFSMCGWRYPDNYDVNELPTPGQSYIDPDTYVQRLYYDVDKLEIACEGVGVDYLSYQDLNKDAYTEAAFQGNGFLKTLNPPDEGCDGDEVTCLFSTIESVEYDVFEETNAQLFIHRFTDVPMYLKCLDMNGYGPDLADMLIEAMDSFFVAYVETELETVILGEAPGGSVYNFASPYDNDSADNERMFFTHGPYYTGGNLVDQVQDDDGILITEYTYGFDVIWFWPHDATDDIIPNVPEVVNDVFDEGAFLSFLQQQYPDVGYFQRASFCEPVDTMPPAPVAPSPPTDAPTPSPTLVYDINEGPCNSDDDCVEGLICIDETQTCECNINTNFGCESGNVCELYGNDVAPKCYCDMYNDGGENGCDDGKVCRFSCAYLVDNPRCFDDEFIRDCGMAWGDGFTCADANGDGVIDQDDISGGCDYNAPTSSPTTRSPTSSPIVAIPSVPTYSPTEFLTFSPTKSPVLPQPAITASPTTETPTESTPIPTPFPTVFPTPTPSCDNASDCANGLCCVENKCQQCVTIPEECTCKPLVGTCGGGNRGDGICPFEGYCCSEWGWCGTTEEYCEGDTAPTPFNGGYQPPTPSLDAGKCGAGNEGEGLCADPDHCCSQWGYCGPGEGYCYTVDDGTNADGTCGAGGVGDGLCRDGHCCSIYGFCGEGELYCTGNNEIVETDAELEVIERSPLPQDLVPQFGYRCGGDELDARGNCKPMCNHHIQCQDGEECWGIQLSYCHTFEEGTHPICTEPRRANEDRRCGFEEVDARELCGPKCDTSADCGSGQSCFPTMLNYCDCFEEMDAGDGSIEELFIEVRSTIEPFFRGSAIADDKSPVVAEGDGTVEGKPRNSASAASFAIGSLFASIFVIFAMN